ncbi:MAG: peptidoglycan DD-metalloendopeptidase family protein [Clostridia bacterium]
MKIKFENIIDKFLEKLNLKRITKEDKGKVIKFEKTIEDKKSDTLINNNLKEEKKARTGSLEIETNKNNKRISMQGVKILTSMVLLLMLSLSLGLKDQFSLYENDVQPKDVSSVTTSSSIDNATNNVTDSNEKVLATKATEKVVTKKVEEKLVFTKPLDGEIQKMYSTDKVIYSKTLSQWKTHDGLDISVSSSAEVKAIEKGVVEDIYNDSFYGKTIIIEHISGYKSQYSNLEENVYVNIGESVVKGQKIGKVGNTSVGEYLDDPHLHFMLFLNDKSINPTYLYD